MSKIIDDERLALLPAKDGSRPPAISQELGLLIRYSLPIVLSNLCTSSFTIVTVASVGRLGTYQLASASLGIITYNFSCHATICGLSFSLDTLCAQAWTSAHPELMSLHVMRVILVTCYALVVPVICLFNAESIFLAVGQEPRIAALAGTYIRIILTATPGHILNETVRKWLQTQGRTLAPAVTICVTTLANCLLNYLLVWSEAFGIGFLGSPIATSISINSMALLLLAHCYFFVPRTGWCGFRMSAFTGWGPCFKLGLAGLALDSSEWLAYETAGLAASALNPTAMAAQAILTIFTAFYYRPYQAFGAAGAIRIGNLLGAGDGERAALTTKICLYSAVVLGCLGTLSLVVLRHPLERLLTSEPNVLALTDSVIPILCCYQLVDAFKSISQGLLFGIGRTTGGAIYLILSYYCIGIPVGLYLTFGPARLGLRGLWGGLALGLTFTCVLLTQHVMRTDWDLEVANARERNRQAYEGRKATDDEEAAPLVETR